VIGCLSLGIPGARGVSKGAQWGSKGDPRGTQGGPGRAQGDPRGAQGESKGGLSGPKVYPRGASGRQSIVHFRILCFIRNVACALRGSWGVLVDLGEPLAEPWESFGSLGGALGVPWGSLVEPWGPWGSQGGATWAQGGAQGVQGAVLGGPNVPKCNRGHQNRRVHGECLGGPWMALGCPWGSLGSPWGGLGGTLGGPWGALGAQNLPHRSLAATPPGPPRDPTAPPQGWRGRFGAPRHALGT